MKPQILFILHMPPPVHGASMMGQYIHDSALINERFDCFFLNETRSTDVSHVGKFSWYKVKSILKHSKTIANMVREIKPDLVYITPSAYQPETGMVRYIFEFAVLNFYSCKKLIHFHNKGDKTKCKRLLFRWYYKMLFKNSKVIFLSHILKKQFDWILSPKQIKVCPNGIKETLEYEFIPNRENISTKLLFLSNLIESKGVIILMDAIKVLISKGYQIECDFVGAESVDIDSKIFNQEVIKRDLDQIIKYHGKKFGEEKNSFFKNADIFVFPTFYPGECFPLVLLEAMEYKLPLISTNNGAIEEIVLDGLNGFLCKQQDSVSLAESIEKLIINKDMCIKMGEEGYKMFKDKFTLSKFENKIVELIEETLENK